MSSQMLQTPSMHLACSLDPTRLHQCSLTWNLVNLEKKACVTLTKNLRKSRPASLLMNKRVFCENSATFYVSVTLAFTTCFFTNMAAEPAKPDIRKSILTWQSKKQKNKVALLSVEWWGEYRSRTHVFQNL